MQLLFPLQDLSTSIENPELLRVIAKQQQISLGHSIALIVLVRNNLVIEGVPGDIIELSGIVRHKDCQTPYENAKVELWHCSADEIYDNDSDEYRYRGTSYCDSEGKYKFTTQMPVEDLSDRPIFIS